MPERVEPEQPIAYQSIVVLGDSHWALAVNNADQSVHLQPADIRWRKHSGKRPWLAGTVLDRLCALLDVGVLIAMLDASDTARQVKADLDRDQ
jgi:purine-binding chemotaxis protein CheW